MNLYLDPYSMVIGWFFINVVLLSGIFLIMIYSNYRKDKGEEKDGE